MANPSLKALATEYDVLATRESARPQLDGETTPLAIRWADDIVDPEVGPELVERLIPGDGALVGLIGASGSGKTFLATTLAVAVATGTSFLGRRTTKRHVLYLAPEAPRSVNNRILAARREGGHSPLPIAICAGALDLLQAGRPDVDEIVATVRKNAIGLVIVDTFARILGPGDENSASDVGRIVEALGAVQREGGATVVIVHHVGKDRDRGPRGSSALFAALDVSLEVANDDGCITLKVVKSRDGICGDVLHARLRPVDLGVKDQWGSALTSCVVEPAAGPTRASAPRTPKGTELAFRALREMISETGELLAQTSTIPAGTRAVVVTTWRRRYYALDAADAEDRRDPDGVKRAEAARKKRFDRAREGLLNSGAVGSTADWVWIAR